jgi:hypothetical protein
MRKLNIPYRLLLCINVLIVGCGQEQSVSSNPVGKKPKKKFVFTERMIKGTDTAMVALTAGIDMVLAQHWYLDDVSAVSHDKLVWENGDGERIFPSLNLFPDSTALENPRGELQIAKWHRSLNNKVNTIQLDYGKGKSKSYRIRELSHRNLLVSWTEGDDSCWIRFRSDGLAHQNMYYDPYHPSNNQWRIKPSRRETAAEIKSRVKDCVKFYALYYRDNIKRKKDVIEFLGFPELFRWYNGGIGLPEKKNLSESWVACFYNKAQAEEGFDILNQLLIDNEFDWPTGTPGWHYRTLSVLEQMHEKL